MKNIVQTTFFSLCAFTILMLSSCYEQEGCQDPDAVNYDILAEVDDGNCTFPNVLINFTPIIRDTIETDTSVTPVLIPVGPGQLFDINGTQARLDDISFNISDMVFTTEKETFSIDNSDSLNTEKIYNIDTLKVADITEITFNIIKMDIGWSIDADSSGQYTDDEKMALACPFTTPIQIAPSDQRVNQIDDPVDITLDLEAFFSTSNLSQDPPTCPGVITNNLFSIK